MNMTSWGPITHFPATFFLKLAPFLSPACSLPSCPVLSLPSLACTALFLLATSEPAMLNLEI